MRRMMRSVACAVASLVTRSTGGRRNGSPITTRTCLMEYGFRKIHGQATPSVPVTATGRMGAPVRRAIIAVPGWPRVRPPVRLRVPSGNITSSAPSRTSSPAARTAERSPAPPRRPGEGADGAEGGPQDRPADHLALRHVHRIARLDGERDGGRVGVVQVVAGDDDAAFSRDMLPAHHLELPAVDEKAELIYQDDAAAVHVYERHGTNSRIRATTSSSER